MVARHARPTPPQDVAALYNRISQRFGETDDNLDTQESMGRRFAEERGLVIPPEWIFREKDSGYDTADDRVLLLRLRQLARDALVGHIIIKDTDRLAREPVQLVSLWREFLDAGVKVHFIRSPTEDTPAGKMMLLMRGIGHEMEWNMIRERTTDRKREIRRSGRVVGEGGARFGLRWVRTEDGKITRDRTLAIDEVAAEWVRLIFRMVGDEGMSMRRVAAELNRREIPTPSVYRGNRYKDGRRPRWTNSHVRLVVIDETYKGVATANRVTKVAKRTFVPLPRDQWTELPNANLPIVVDPALWDRANAAIRCNDIIGERTRRKTTAATRNIRDFALFRGMIWCGVCGQPLRVAKARRWNPLTKDHRGAGHDIIYRCDARQKADERADPGERCHGKAVYEEKVREAAWETIVRVITTDGMIEAEARRLQATRPGEALFRESLAAAEAEVATAERRSRNLIDQMADEDRPEMRGMIREKLENLKLEQAGSEKRAAGLREKLRVYDEIDARVAALRSRADEIRKGLVDPTNLTWQERRRVMDWIDARFTGNGTKLSLRLDLGLEDVLSVPGDATSNTYRNAQRMAVGWDIPQPDSRKRVTA